MIGRLIVGAGLLGVVAVHRLALLPAWPGVLAWGLLPLALLGLIPWLGGRPQSRIRSRFLRHARLALWLGRLLQTCRMLLACLSAALLAAAVTVFWAERRLDQTLDAGNTDRVSRVILRVQGLPRLQPDRVRFEAEVLQAHPPGVPQRILVNWSASGWRSPYAAAKPADPPFPDIYAGQVWRMALVLRPIQAAQNITAFDYEGHAFAADIRATGTVRGAPEYLHDEPWHSLSTVADRARHHIRQAMAPYLAGKRYGAVLRALAIGDQDGMDDADWTVFNRTGLTHLVSISGSHITMLAGMGGLSVIWGWRRFSWRGRLLAERWPARRAGACAALLVAWLYCLLAGWGVPAQRTFMMLAVVAGAQILQLRLSGARVLALAALVVVALDPWSVLASGFWLSFAAVGVLLAVGLDSTTAAAGDVPVAAPTLASCRQRWLRGLRLAARLQWAITLALAPVLAWIFHEVSLVSPLANAYAIPLIELLVTPLSLLLAACALVPGLDWLADVLAWLAHGVLDWMMVPTAWLARLPTWPVPTVPAGLYLLASAGVAVALWPRRTARQSVGAQARGGWSASALRWPVWLGGRQRWGWLALLPMLMWVPARPALGEWDLHALDVGQGSALLVRTAKHAILFDTGARHARDSDEGVRTVVPVARALGVRRLDVLVVSHADLDHAGGVRSILEAMPVEQTYSSFDLPAWLRREARLLQAEPATAPLAASFCQFGGRWQIDGVSFEFLWPLDVRGERKGVQANAGSCVLRVRGRYHSLLLTGDIEARTESVLVARGLTPVDVVVAAHHGSRTSSSAAFVAAVSARHVIMQVGRWNRHGHPADAVLRRWQQADTQVWRTDWQGGVNAESRADGLSLYSVLKSSRRYWHGQRP
ncbi:DNA internalization-related competence protein ComEC/Rec2 [Castellaniella sp.]|uniref:DNA internalization-related competence protein ComEC/Rec2 n=1 Tax=Castellaniella sp. TaxID=1955812 RepID=UPI002AFE8D78|nr:DNA internalization-related competence protein ComEC/Rec2 [Castellaniella sp.]